MPRIKMIILAAFLAASLGQSPAGCPVLSGLTSSSQPEPLPVPPVGSILLYIDNQSGLQAIVDASFVVGSQEVRHTTRLMAVDGPESTASIIKTTADQVSVSAQIATPATGNGTSKYRGGFVLAQKTYLRGVDFQDQDAIPFTIPPPPPDCNGNGQPDATDIAQAVSRDCDGDGIPDECESGAPTILQCAGNVVVSADAHGAGVVPDLRAMVQAVDSCTPSDKLVLAQDAAPGTPLTLNVPRAVVLTVTDGDGNKTQCTSSVTMVDVTPPVVQCPGDMTVVVNDSCETALPDFSTQVFASDNSSARSDIQIHQSTPPGQMVPMGTTVITIQAVDASGNTSQCTMNFRVGTKSVRNAQRCGVPVLSDPEQ